MTQAFLVYNLLLLTLFVTWKMAGSGASASDRAQVDPARILLAYFSVLVFTLVLGLRDNVGGDYESYVGYYEMTMPNVASSDVPFEVGFYWLIRALRAFDLPPWSLFLATCAIQMIAMSAWLSRQTNVAPWLIYFYFTTLLGFEALNTIRQAMAFTFVLLAIQALVDRRRLMYLFWVVLASSLHISALLFVPLVAVLNLRWFESRVWMLGLLLLAYVTANAVKDALFEVLPLFALVDAVSGYSALQDKLFFEREVSGISAGMVFALLVDSLVILCSPYLLRRYAAQGFRAYFNAYCIGALLTPAVVAANYITFARLAFYFTSFRFVMLGFLLAWLLSREQQAPWARPVGLLLVAAYFASFTVAIVRGAAWCAPFQFIFQ